MGVLRVVGARVLRISLIPGVLRLRTGRRRYDDRADDCQRDECRMKFLAFGAVETIFYSR